MNWIERFLIFCFGVILNLDSLVLGRDICDIYSGTYTYCDDGYHCCNDNTKCCPNGISVGAVAGIIFGSLFLVCICVFCTIAVTKKKKFRPNQLVRPHNEPNIAISTVSARAHGHQRNYLQNQQFYPYGQTFSYDPAFTPSSVPIHPPPYSQADNSAVPPPPAYKLEP